jgi:hypothetical protein
MDRRDVFKIFGAGLAIGPEVLAAHEHAVTGAVPVDVARYQPRFLSAQEYKVLGQLCNIIMPADEASPGACEAGAPFYIDSLLLYAPPERQQAWRSGLEQVQGATKAKFGRLFEQCRLHEQEEIVTDMARDEANPQTPLQNFFRPLKDLTLTAYCLSDAGMRQYLGYRGDRPVKDFPGCTHPQHQS